MREHRELFRVERAKVRETIESQKPETKYKGEEENQNQKDGKTKGMTIIFAENNRNINKHSVESLTLFIAQACVFSLRFLAGLLHFSLSSNIHRLV